MDIAQIQAYWEDRANNSEASATTNDVALRELEANALISTIKELAQKTNIPKPKILDLGCGDGKTTIALALALPEAQIIGIDYSESMLALAHKNKLRLNTNNINFQHADMQNIKTKFAKHKFDFIITVRSLINLPNKELQYTTINASLSLLKQNGYLVGIENFISGQNNLNQVRAIMNLPAIPVRWHNLFFDDHEFISKLNPEYTVIFNDFSSSYYFATRIIYSALCALDNKKPEYTHAINYLATNLPSFGNFSPVKMFIAQKKLP